LREVELGQHLAQAEHVAVGIDQARQQGLAAHVDAARARCLGAEVGGVADGQDLALGIECERRELHQFTLAVERVSVGVLDHRLCLYRHGGDRGKYEHGTLLQGGAHGLSVLLNKCKTRV